MNGLILSFEQIRSAPPEVRQWLRALLEAEFGPASHPGSDSGEEAGTGLAACSLEEARQVFERIRDDHLAAQVFFELGRESPGQNIRSSHLHRATVLEIARNVRLGNLRHLAACLEAIAGAFREVKADPDAALFASDGRGAIYIHEITHQSIARLWQELVLGYSSTPAFGGGGRPMPAASAGNGGAAKA